ncbi:uncharacterized protein BHQ10_006173 [Talaromyces amestolkiae]|uniref:RCC1-like domain-containing protein n=1 Tax=Talaromyces amestolkiae TaxID=1196081 RepID=A0A364L366_TALAM|nr:uncharacterized protein BHQ10_006173 [Talaromyces amestolkiae]RAO70161.1 hypothetical protein BHQ10_006173 [Talaromyces amestolkiae]
MERILALGSNGSGQLGIGHRDDVSEATKCIFDIDTDSRPNKNNGKTVETRDTVKRISCGGNHTLVLFESGTVYAAGLNEDLRCGVHRTDLNRGEDGDVLTRFKRVIFRLGATGVEIDRFRDVCATWSASCFVASIPSTDKNGDGKNIVISLGTGDKGELGLGPGLRSTPPARNKDDHDFIDVDDYVLTDFPPLNTRIETISSGMNHVVTILSNGDFYGWGASRKGQLGDDINIVRAKAVWAPMKIDVTKLEAVPTSVSCGREFTFIDGYKKDETGVKEGQYMYTILGTNDKWNIVSAAPPVQTLQRSSLTESRYEVSTSWHGVYLHNTLDNSVIAWGRNDRGQLGVDKQSSGSQQSLVRWESVVQFMAGSEHAIAVLSRDKTVVSCGWGEHGNCGPDTDERGDVKGRLSQIPLPADVLHAEKARIVRVGAGCATSWIVVSS